MRHVALSLQCHIISLDVARRSVRFITPTPLSVHLIGAQDDMVGSNRVEGQTVRDTLMHATAFRDPARGVSSSGASLCLDPGILHPWFAVRVRSRFEKAASAYLRGRGLDEFPALYTARRRWSDRYREVELPLFPGYIFCRFDPRDQIPVLSAPGVVSIVCFGGVPQPVDEREIEAVHAVIGSGLPAHPWPFLQTGQRVLVEYGALQGIEGIVVQFKKELRILISVTILQRSVMVEIDRDWVRPIGSVNSATAR